MMGYWLRLFIAILKTELPSAANHVYSGSKDYRYRKKQFLKRQLLFYIWLMSGLFMLINPVLPVILIIVLPTTFLSFMILDETK